ncbi:MAG: hypothetical protein ABIG61_02700 [Planctomycetota bacterium]
MAVNEALSLKYKPDLENTRRYWDAFWNHEIIDRPCTIIRAKRTDNAVEAPRLQAVTADFRQTFDKFDSFLESHSFLGECIPGFRPGFGPDQMAGFLGAPIVISRDSDDTSWSEKIVEDWKDFLPLKLDENNQTWQRMKQFHAAAAEHYKGKCLIYNIDLHSNIDTLEALRGAQKLLFDLIDQPEVIAEAMDQVRPLYMKIYNELHEFGNKKHLGTNSDIHFYSRGKTDYIQADFICLLSPDMFRKFVLPAIEEEAQFLDNSCFHLDGPDALKHLDDILTIEQISLIQWVPGAGNKPAYDWPDVIHKIQAAGKATVFYGNCDEIKAVHGRYKPELLVYDVQAESEAQGLDLLDWLKKHT